MRLIMWITYFNPKKIFYEDLIPRLGDKKAARYSKLVFEHYKRFAMIETGAYDAERLFKEVAVQAKFFHKQTYRIACLELLMFYES